jgi:hypothetical protein
MNTRTVAQLFKFDVEEMFNQWDASKPLRSGMPHASAILAPESSYCLRSLVLAATHPEEVERPPLKPWTTKNNQVFLNGWSLHEKYQSLLLKFGRPIEIEKSHFDEEHMLHYTPDAIVEHCHEHMVVEIKGYKAEAFDTMDELKSAPDAAHKQVNLYMHLLNLEHGLILVENKNTQKMKCWCVERDEEMVRPSLDRIERFQEALHKALPTRICSSKSDRNAEKCISCKTCFSKKG